MRRFKVTPSVTVATIVDGDSLLWRDLKDSPAAKEPAVCTAAAVLSCAVKIASFVENQWCGGIFSIWNPICEAVEHGQGPLPILLAAESEGIAILRLAASSIGS